MSGTLLSRQSPGTLGLCLSEIPQTGDRLGCIGVHARDESDEKGRRRDDFIAAARVPCQATGDTAVSPNMLRLGNFAASLLFATLALLAYRLSPHSQGMIQRSWSEDGALTGADVLYATYAGYGLSLLVYYLLERSPRESKSIAALRALKRATASPVHVIRNGLPPAERLGLLTILLKVFFAPLMLLSLFGWTINMVTNGTHILSNLESLQTDFLGLFNAYGFWFLLGLIVFADVVFFTVGYLLEHPTLKNEIRSVDPTWLGWAAALACYPPFNALTDRVLGRSISEFPQFDDPTIHVAVNVALLALMGIYASSSAALNFKASNLTHRGIIDHGPYRYVRHPAYACKNAAWWLGSIPLIAAGWNESIWSAVIAVAATAGWTGLYALRAITEEDHLRKVDGEYEAYCQKVRYRFIPGVL